MSGGAAARRWGLDFERALDGETERAPEPTSKRPRPPPPNNPYINRGGATTRPRAPEAEQ